jgi:predicted GIY-YIG superfamily endonuclease
MEGWRGKNIRMKWLEIAIGEGKLGFLPEAVIYTGVAQDFETRLNAFNLLKKLDYLDEETTRNAVYAAVHWNRKLSAGGQDFLRYFYQQDLKQKMIREVISGMSLSPDDLKTLNRIANP